VNFPDFSGKFENFAFETLVGYRKKAGEMRIRLPISVTDRSQITNLPTNTKILKGRMT